MNIKKEYNYEFYTTKRWDNWIKQLENSDFTIENKNEKEINIFVNMIDDVILSCLKITARFDKKFFDIDESIKNISIIKNITLKKVGFISEDINMMLISVQNSLQSIFSSFETYIYGSFDLDINPNILIKEIIEYEKKKNLEMSFEILSIIGAMIISGKKISSTIFLELEQTIKNPIIGEWIDGVDSIIASMEGTDNYKDFDDCEED